MYIKNWPNNEVSCNIKEPIKRSSFLLRISMSTGGKREGKSESYSSIMILNFGGKNIRDKVFE